MQQVGALASAACMTSLIAGCARPATGTPPTASSTTEAPLATVRTLEPLGTTSDASASEAGLRASASGGQAQTADPPPARLGSCDLKATLRRAPSGKFSLVLRNGGSRPLELVLPGDGSEAGWRTPTLTWTATSGGKAVSVDGARCGLTNPIEAKEIFSLAPGAERSISEWISAPSLSRGTYELSLTYRNDPRFAGKVTVTEGAKRALEGSSACEVTTAPLRVTML